MSAHICDKLKKSCPDADVVDGFCGSGGLAIQLAARFKNVTCIDIDRMFKYLWSNSKIQNIENNLKVYGQTARVLCMNFLDYQHEGPEPIVTLCPPWYAT